jgi:hypothetical protein
MHAAPARTSQQRRHGTCAAPPLSTGRMGLCMGLSLVQKGCVRFDGGRPRRPRRRPARVVRDWRCGGGCGVCEEIRREKEVRRRVRRLAEGERRREAAQAVARNGVEESGRWVRCVIFSLGRIDRVFTRRSHAIFAGQIVSRPNLCFS